MRERARGRKPRRRTRDRKTPELTPAKTGNRLGSPRNPATRESATPTTVVLLEDAPPATVISAVAGTTRVHATLTARRPLRLNNHIIQEWISSGGIEGVRGRFYVSGDEERVVEVEGEISSFDSGCMGRACEAIARGLSGVAALSDSVFEVRFAREAEPRYASVGAVAEVSEGLSAAGFSIRTDVSWNPGPRGDVWLGVGGDDEMSEKLREFVGAHPRWRVV